MQRNANNLDSNSKETNMLKEHKRFLFVLITTPKI